MNILISSYACNYNTTDESYPGEALVGWNLIKQISKFNKLFVITRKYNKKDLEKAKRTKKIKNTDFIYLDMPYFLKTIRNNFFGFRIYYWLWQIKAYFLARNLNREHRFEAFQQVTFNNDWMPSYIGAYLNLSFFWGPAGGGQKVPRTFGKELSIKDRLNEIARVILQEFWRHTPTRIIGMKKAKAVLVCNEETKEKVKKFTKNIFDFPVNGISKEDLLPDRRPMIDDRKRSVENSFRVLFAGRFDPIKAIPLAVRAFAKFNKEYKNSIFEIIGDGPEKGRINREIEKAGIKNSVKLISWLPREELIERMRGADVFLFPSLRDGGGAVVIEAMASGVPVVCFNLAGPGFHIQNKWGIKIKAKNPEYAVIEMTKALEKLYLDSNLRIQMGINARKRAEEYYLWDHLGKRLQEIYKEALNIRG